MQVWRKLLRSLGKAVVIDDCHLATVAVTEDSECQMSSLRFVV